MGFEDRLPPEITAVVCTRGRGAGLMPTVRSILANDHPSFELVIIDQSPDDSTASAVAVVDDPRMRFIRMDGAGLGRARNRGLSEARSTIVGFADDDVTVPCDWLTVIADLFVTHPAVAVSFSNVLAGPHDPSKGFVPAYQRAGTHEVTSIRGKLRACGIGAGMSVRRTAVMELGGFDPALGAGGRFPSCEDGDVAVRALLRGWHVLETDRVAVVHHGFRTWEEGRELTRRDWIGIGAAYSKPIRVGHFRVFAVVAWEGLVRAVLRPLIDSIRTRKPSGLRQGWYFWTGFARGLTSPVDRATIRFEPAGDAPSGVDPGPG